LAVKHIAIQKKIKGPACLAALTYGRGVGIATVPLPVLHPRAAGLHGRAGMTGGPRAYNSFCFSRRGGGCGYRNMYKIPGGGVEASHTFVFYTHGPILGAQQPGALLWRGIISFYYPSSPPQIPISDPALPRRGRAGRSEGAARGACLETTPPVDLA
jgi:hypothetical protein